MDNSDSAPRIAAAMPPIVLASASPARIALLSAAGIAFTAKAAVIDERALEAPLLATGTDPAAIAAALAEAKAIAVSRGEGDAIVIGADQMLELDGERLTKPATMAEARDQLARLGGRTHALRTAVAAARQGQVVWRHQDSAHLTMRVLDDAIIDDYLSRVGETALTSVGAYQIEGPGIQLFETITGDYFTILGLPLLPVLGFLRGEGAIA